jgi:hypothetical protein
MHRNCLLTHFIEGKIEEKIEAAERQERRRKQLLDDLKQGTGCWKLKQETPDRTV